jgi:hypothetical protein
VFGADDPAAVVREITEAVAGSHKGNLPYR